MIPAILDFIYIYIYIYTLFIRIPFTLVPLWRYVKYAIIIILNIVTRVVALLKTTVFHSL